MPEEIGPGRSFGSYQVLEELGRGGMGRVFRARHVTLERDVALKLLAEPLAADPSYVQRFLKEARAAARLNHPGIVQIYDFGQVGARWYLAMELVDGRSLAHFLRVWGRFTEQGALVIARQALAALAVAHAAGLVHRDVKPDNLILARKGVVKLVDLGLARRVDDPGASTTGSAAGTPYYISPEQIEGRSDVDARADLYSLGATLFQLVTGEVPFPGPSSASIMARHLREAAPDPRTLAPGLSEGFARAILRLMARDRDLRPPNAEAAARELAALRAAPTLAPASLPPGWQEFATTITGVPAPAAVRGPGRQTGRQRPARSAPPPSEPPGPLVATPPGWDSDVLRRVEERLAIRVGPLAGVLVRRTAREAVDFGDLCRRVASQIPDEAARPAFLREVLHGEALTRPSVAGAGPESPSPHAGASPLRPGPSPPGAGRTPAHGPFPPGLLAAVEQALAAEIGPLARVLVRQEARHHASFSAVVEALAGHVPEEAGRARFRAALAAPGPPRV